MAGAIKRSGYAELPLHYGHVPLWLAERMGKLGLAITESIIAEYGKAEFLRRMSDPFWFQSLGCVMGMDWHSSGITTSVLGALKRVINPQAKELGIYFCGGKGNASRQTPAELMRVGEQTGLDGDYLARCSRLSAKVDNTAIQDGYNLYLHSFIVSDEGQWTVVQQGMKTQGTTARRYHWHSASLTSFVEEPHTSICGENQGNILNMVAREAVPAQSSIIGMTHESPERMMREIRNLTMPNHHDVRGADVDLKRLGSMLWLAHEKQPRDFEELLLLEGLGPRTLQSLALVSEVIYGTPSRFTDPARFSFAHGGKDGHPFPVPIKIYDETLTTLRSAIDKAKLGAGDKQQAIKSLSELAIRAEKNFIPNENIENVIAKEREDSWKYEGRTVFGKAKEPKKGDQLKLF
ncbi:MAG TPA: DUF763 domain-containing protein [Cyclobacteriaceae bacterium]|jgi:hypothetical protein|nr:DUF763 domain-containing protein [Cyclobacteriaceae bacterium]